MAGAAPRFDDVTGRPLNHAAQVLLDSTNRTTQTTSSNGAGRDLPAARIAQGTWKYVLLQAGVDARLFVRNTAHLDYHAEMAHVAIKELAQHDIDNVKVLGGGRIAYIGNPPTISIFGYSKSAFPTPPPHSHKYHVDTLTPDHLLQRTVDAKLAIG